MHFLLGYVALRTRVDKLYTLVVRSDLLIDKASVEMIDNLEINKRYRFQIALDISNISATRTSWILARLFDHVVDQTIAVKNTLIDDLEADYLSAFLVKIHRCGRH